jgi:hypothetical protein
MAFRVYLSHSVAPAELGAIYGIAELAARKGTEPIIPDRQWRPDALPARIQQLLQGVDAFVVIATSFGTETDWVNAELSMVLRAGVPPNAIVSVVDAGVLMPPAGQTVTIDRGNFAKTLRDTVELLERLQMERNQRNLLAGMLLGGLAVLLFASRD